MKVLSLIRNAALSTIMPLLPKEDLSTWVGKMARQPIPRSLRPTVLGAFAAFYNINLDEAEKPLTEYTSFGDFFSRRLRSDARPIGNGFLHCADAVISGAGAIQSDTLMQAKGRAYSVEGLLRSPKWAKVFQGGWYLTYYLCPTDYHRVHSPIAGQVVWSAHIPGSLWPVNDWSLQNIDGVFEKNERVAWVMQDRQGRHIALVMVAATNVGSIAVGFDPSITTHDHSLMRAMREKQYQPGPAFQAGDEIGVFHMGSTVVLLAEASWGWDSLEIEKMLSCPTRVRATLSTINA